MKTRMKRGSNTKKEDPDYWETSRPIKKDGMVEKDRQTPVKREVVYLDFRAEVSAFDKIFHFGKGDISEKKEFLRKRTKYLNRLFNEEPIKYHGSSDDSLLGNVCELDDESRKIAGKIWGKEYTSIKIAEHKFFINPGTSILVKTQLDSKYSEENAGSGEVAVIQLVRKIQSAQDYSLVLLDEPEVSIYPGAQKKLKDYLLDMIIQKKLQIVISTHSPILIDKMPNQSLKLFVINTKGQFEIREQINYQEAFFDLQENVPEKKIIFCEDFAAKILIEKILMRMGKNQFFDVQFNPGGEKTIITRYIPTLVSNKYFTKNVFLILDGDMDSEFVFNKDELKEGQLTSSEYLKQCIIKAYGAEIDANIDSGTKEKQEKQICTAFLKYLDYYNNNIYFLPSKSIPEKIILDSNFTKDKYRHILSVYKDITNQNAKRMICEILKEEYGDENHTSSVIENLSYKWSLEEGEDQKLISEYLNEIFEKN